MQFEFQFVASRMHDDVGKFLINLASSLLLFFFNHIASVFKNTIKKKKKKKVNTRREKAKPDSASRDALIKKEWQKILRKFEPIFSTNPDNTISLSQLTPSQFPRTV